VALFITQSYHFVPMQKNAAGRRDQAFHANGALQDIAFPLCKEMCYAARKVSPATPSTITMWRQSQSAPDLAL
jgi:hypothetical protein